MNINEFPPSKELYFQVRGGFVTQGYSLGAWCKENGYARSNAVSALTGSWDGPKGRELRLKLIEASGINKWPRLTNKA